MRNKIFIGDLTQQLQIGGITLTLGIELVILGGWLDLIIIPAQIVVLLEEITFTSTTIIMFP
jgi:hypothetical protein